MIEAPALLNVIILAAGYSRRMGRDKATLPWGDVPLVRHVVDQFPRERVKRILVVANPANQEAVRTCLDENVEIIVNDVPDAAMIDSIKLALAKVGGDGGPLCIHPVDVFAVCAKLIETLHDAWRNAPERIHLPQVGGRGAHPIIIPSGLTSAIVALPPGVGLNQLLRDHGDSVERHVWQDERLRVDLDTPDEYERHRPPPRKSS